MAESTTPKFDSAVFGVEATNHELLKIAYESYLAENRQVGAKTLTRGKVRGGGKKPWRQKGTGRARFGSSRNPIWRGGGIVFGPRGNENHIKKLTTTSKRVAVRQALSLSNKANKLFVDDFTFTEGKTKEAIALLAKHKIDPRNRVLLVVEAKDELTMHATNNVQQIKVIRPTYLNVFDILNADTVLISPKALPMITEWLAKGEK